eukprot:CAMPEP_0113827270 /NCGR_PEP_ID=MMETSP0328-20130328/4681_1 /TAXON_ID=39455 /ORGANISM="Alexandrium minutum" /LENGTH=59 /DNA_ID=CAMNT_0000795255 /DNA_START=105 /DNA_END=280 /DNA_ORIENTATION=- /assembly_acc=CAM_ASM_000350
MRFLKLLSHEGMLCGLAENVYSINLEDSAFFSGWSINSQVVEGNGSASHRVAIWLDRLP